MGNSTNTDEATHQLLTFGCVAAAAAKSLQSCLTLCDPMDSSPPGSSVHRTLQARILEWVAISFSVAAVQPVLNPCSIPMKIILKV